MTDDQLGRSLRRARAIRWEVRPEILLCPQIPAPMHGVNPRTVKGQTWWNQTRREAYRRTCFHCAACGVWKHEAKFHRWLEAHETYVIDYLLGKMEYVETVALCNCCHSFIHVGRLEALRDRGEITQQRFLAVVQHGERVLMEAGLRRPRPYDGVCAEWSDWRLVLDGREYPPLYSSPTEWASAHGYFLED